MVIFPYIVIGSFWQLLSIALKAVDGTAWRPASQGKDIQDWYIYAPHSDYLNNCNTFEG